MKTQIAFTNANVVTPFRCIDNGTVVVEGEWFKEVGASEQIRLPEHVKVIDVKGDYLSPGFIDLHIHGAWGGNVMSGTIGDLQQMAEGLVRNGVTSFLPTTVAAPLTKIEKAVDCIQRAINQGRSGGAGILGAHLEGPYLNQKPRGAQHPDYIIDPKKEEYLFHPQSA